MVTKYLSYKDGLPPGHILDEVVELELVFLNVEMVLYLGFFFPFV